MPMRAERPDEMMKLGAFFDPTGNHVAAWLHPDAQIDAGTNYQHYAQLAQTAERGEFDLMFLADAVAVRDGKLSALSRWPQYMVFFGPLTLLSAIAPVTRHLGLLATATTSYNGPYNLVRRFASLDHISGGRVGWNVVTSTNLAKYGRAPDELKILPGLNPVVGHTAAEAEEKHRFLQSLIHPDVGLELLSNALGGFDLSEYDLDGPLPDVQDHLGILGGQTSFRNVMSWAREEKLTIRQLYERYAGTRGQRTIIGSPTQVADHMTEWFLSYGVDGFLIQPPYLPRGGLTILSIW
jgi:alkanesulfonate monooxygenase SsuD/methylene tetrahydromethanopterin reductase-like flavin-dependent oxidoreductase (luciferase family)